MFWWTKATEFGPQWSYFHIELASLYTSFGEPNKAEAILKNCLNFYHPKDHCQEYFDRLSKGRDFEPPGFWRAKILAIPG